MINQEALAKAIKPMVWTPYESANGAHASSVVGNHEVHHFDGWGWRTSADYWEFHRTETEGEAKAAAQADYVARILSAFNIEALPHVDRAGVLEEAVRTPSGETLMGIPVAAYMSESDLGGTFATHWSTLPEHTHPVRLFRETDLRRALAQPAVNTSPEGVGGAGGEESAVLAGIAAELREHQKLKYMGNCKCGHCQLVPDDLVNRAAYWLEIMAWFVTKHPAIPSPTDERSK